MWLRDRVEDLTDVEAGSAAPGQVLTWDGSGWVADRRLVVPVAAPRSAPTFPGYLFGPDGVGLLVEVR